MLVSFCLNFLLILEIAMSRDTSIVHYILVLIILFEVLKTFFNIYLNLCNRIFGQKFVFFCTISHFLPALNILDAV